MEDKTLKHSTMEEETRGENLLRFFYIQSVEKPAPANHEDFVSEALLNSD